MTESYYSGLQPNHYLPYDRLVAIQHYIMPNFGTINWEKVSRPQVTENIKRLNNSDGAVYDKIQLYIHIPYCKNICHYCSFSLKHFPRQNFEELDLYVEYLIKETDFYLNLPYVKDRTFSSVCIGGGSPSTLPVPVLQKLFDYLSKKLPDYDSLEKTFTGEARTLKNPDLLKLLKDYGWNRITWGIETLDDTIRKYLGRLEKDDDIDAVFNGLEKIGFTGEKSVDIMYNLPGQTVSGFKNELFKLTETYNPDLIDAYSTIYLPYRPLWRLISEGRVPQPCNIWDLLEMREYLYDDLTGKGYHSVSSETFSKNKSVNHYFEGQCAREDIIPVGISARGNFKDMVTVNPDTIETWMKNIDDYGVSTQNLQSIGRNGVFNRIMVMWPRYKTIAKDTIEQYRDVSCYPRMKKTLRHHVESGVAIEHEDRYEISKLGIIWHGNLQTDYMRHTLNPYGLFLFYLLSYPKKNFGNEVRFRKKAVTNIIWDIRKKFPNFK